MRKILFLLIYIVLRSSLFAQTFSGSLEHQPVTVGEPFMIEYVLEGAIGVNFMLPEYDKSVFFLMEQNESKQIMEDNGIRRVSNTFALTFKPLQPGHHLFSPATITIDGIHRRMRSNPLEVEVENSKGFQQQQAQTPIPSPIPTNANEDVVLMGVPSKTSAYLGEPILLTYKLLTRKNLAQPQVTDNPQYSGFWRDDLETKASDAQVEMYDGKRFTAYEVKRELLYPQKTGDLVIPTFGLQVKMQMGAQSWIEKILGAPVMQQTIQINSQPITIHVKPLPTQGQPRNFNGWIGDFKADFNLLNNPTKVGEPLQLTVTLAGKGNLRMTTPPTWEVGNNFESYEPETEDHLHKATHDITGFRIFKYSIIPNKAGDFTLPPLKLYFFNYETHRYDSIISPSYSVKVLENANMTSSGNSDHLSPSDSLSFQPNMSLAGLSLQNWKESRPSFIWIWIILANILLGSLGMSLYAKRKAKKSLASQNAFEIWEKASTYLKTAQQEIENPLSDGFYENLLFSLKTAIQHALGLRNLSFNKSDISAQLVEKNIDTHLIESILSIWQTCEAALFAKEKTAMEKQALWIQTKAIVEKLK